MTTSTTPVWTVCLICEQTVTVLQLLMISLHILCLVFYFEITEHSPSPPPVYKQYGEHRIVIDAPPYQPLPQAGAQPNINLQNVGSKNV